jgi:hypothetical protein
MREGDAPVAQRLFVASIAYLFAVCRCPVQPRRRPGAGQPFISAPMSASPRQGRADTRYGLLVALLMAQRRSALLRGRPRSQGSNCRCRTGDPVQLARHHAGNRHPTILVTLVAFCFVRRTGARYLPDFQYSGRLELPVWSIPAMTVFPAGGVAWSAHSTSIRLPIARREASQVQVVSPTGSGCSSIPTRSPASIS